MIGQLFEAFAAACSAGNFFLPTWYAYLVKAGRMVTKNDAVNNVQYCDLNGKLMWKEGDLVLVALGILDIVLRIAGMVAVAFVIWGGIQYITSEGQPDKTKDAQQTIINALIGLVIAIISVSVISFIGNRIGVGG